MVVWVEVGGGLLWAKARSEKEHERCEGELDEHVEGGGEQGEVKVEMIGREHPFVVLIFSISGKLGWRVGARLTIDIDSENMYHNPIRIALTKSLLITS